VVDNRADGGAPGAEGRHPVVLALDGEAVAGFQITETLRPDAARALQMLREDGLAIEILSGDHQARVAALADALGVSRWRGQASPQDKLDRIVDLQGEGHQVAMVGDGINDAPVLARAQVSVAFATGAALAQHQADLLILGDRLSGLTEARRLSVQAMKVVRQNLVFALAYNVLAIPLALVGWLPAWLAGIGMAASSLVVVLNALRLAPAPRRRPGVPAGLVPVSPAQPL
jgi:Cu2+-exporting ATPase